MRATPIPPITPPAIAPALEGELVVVGGCVWVGGWVGVGDDKAVESEKYMYFKYSHNR